MPDRSPFAQLLTAARTDAGLSLAQLAARIPTLTRGRIGDYEHDRRSPDAHTVVTLATALGQDPVEWCAVCGLTHPEVQQSLSDPVFAQLVYQLVKERAQ